MPNVRTSVEGPRGCGYRKGGGIYLVGPTSARPCGKFPIPLLRCPVCDCGIKPSRGWSWIRPDPFLARPCSVGFDCSRCPASGSLGERAGLLWIGEEFYPTPGSFYYEAARLGVSRRISRVPRGFVVGETWILLAHRRGCFLPCDDCGGSGRAIDGVETAIRGGADVPLIDRVEPLAPCGTCKGAQLRNVPAIFHAFRPLRIEYVVRGDETEEELDRLAARGFDLVRVVRVPDGSAPLFEEEDDAVEEEDV